MTAAAGFAVRGWCPGALRPMASGDGLLVRLRPPRGALPIAGALALADAAARFGNGHIDLTRRAGLQLRGVREESHAALLAALSAAGLWTADAEGSPRILVGPLAGIDPGEVADLRPLAAALAAARDLPEVPPKFTLVLDGGGLASLADQPADLRLTATRTDTGRAIVIDSTGNKTSGSANNQRSSFQRRLESMLIVRLLKAGDQKGGLKPTLQSDRRVGFSPPSVLSTSSQPRHPGSRPPIGLLDLGTGRWAVGIAAPFGRVEAEPLARLAQCAQEAGAGDLRLSPWRALYAGVAGRAEGLALLAAAAGAGLISEPGDPLLRVEACPGAPACRSASVDTRGDARRLARLVPEARTIHLSGCAKGCARSAPADLVLVGAEGRYGIVRGGTARDRPEAFVRPEDLEAALGHG